MVRETLTGHSGEGIVLIASQEEWDQYSHTRAKMYVKYVPKKDEYRIHVSGGEVIDQQRKAKRSDFSAENVNWQVRNHHNGFVFVREGVEPPEAVIESALQSVSLCGLDFGAVDVIWNNHRSKAYVLEINTAPGLENTTADNYATSLTSLADYVAEFGPALSPPEAMAVMDEAPTDGHRRRATEWQRFTVRTPDLVTNTESAPIEEIFEVSGEPA